MLASFFLSFRNKTLITQLFGDKSWGYFWETRFLPIWLPLILGLGLGIIEAFLVVQEQWHLAIPVAVAVPVIILFSRYPFVAVFLWFLLLPYFLNEPNAAGRAIYWLIHRAIIPLGLMIVIISNWLGLKKHRPVRWGGVELSMFIFLGVLVFNIFLLSKKGHNQLFIRVYDLLFIPFCLYWLIRFIAPTEKDLKRFLWVALITIIAQSTIGIISWFDPAVLPPKWLGLEGERTVGSLRNVAVYTSTLLFCALLLVQFAENNTSKWIRFGGLTVFGLALYCVFMSFSRGSWVGEIVVLIALIFVYPRTMPRFILVAGIVMYILSMTILSGQVAWGYERLTGETAQQSADSRATANDASISMLINKPFFGWGWGNYDEAKKPFMRRVGNVRVYNDTSHNTYLTVLAELGLVGFLFYYLPVVLLFLSSMKVWKKLPKKGFWNRSLLVVLWLVILHMFIVTNFMDMIRYFPFGNALWWIVLALIANLVYTQPKLSTKNGLLLYGDM